MTKLYEKKKSNYADPMLENLVFLFFFLRLFCCKALTAGFQSSASKQQKSFRGFSTLQSNFVRLAVAVLPPRGYMKETNKDLGGKNKTKKMRKQNNKPTALTGHSEMLPKQNTIAFIRS